MNEKIKFKVTGFNKFHNGDDNDCICIKENGEKFLVDPFVGCAWEYEERGHLLNTWFEADGHWHETGVFLPIENSMKVIQKINSDQ